MSGVGKSRAVVRRRLVGRWLTLSASASIACTVLFPRDAKAAFTQATCSSAGHNTVVPVSIGALEYDRQPQGIPATFNNYQYNVDTPLRDLIVNPNVGEITAFYNYFVTDGTDAFRVFHAGSPNPYVYTGSLNNTNTLTWSFTNWIVFRPFNLYGHLQMKWTTNALGATFAPPSFGQVNVKCVASQTTTAQNVVGLAANTGLDGLLLTTGDTLYFNALQFANTPMLITVEGLAGGADLDLYADSANSTPDSTAPWKAASGERNEAVNIPMSATARTIYIGVRSFFGASHFRIHAYSQIASQRMSLRICPLNFTPTATEKTTIKNLFRTASARLLSGSNGNLWVNSFTLNAQVSSCGTTCDVCLDNGNNGMFGGPQTGMLCGQITIPRSFWSAAGDGSIGIFHEWGHGCYGHADEYKGGPAGDSSQGMCGHSVMNNLSQTRSFCANSHCSDGNVTDNLTCVSQSGADSNWKRMKTNSKVPYGEDFAATVHAPDPTQHAANNTLANLITTTGF